jgi:hypothetical protein
MLDDRKSSKKFLSELKKSMQQVSCFVAKWVCPPIVSAGGLCWGMHAALIMLEQTQPRIWSPEFLAVLRSFILPVSFGITFLCIFWAILRKGEIHSITVDAVLKAAMVIGGIGFLLNDLPHIF